MPEISIVVPVYNTETYLRGCIESILAQTFRDFELFLVDDGSTDTSGEICEEYAEKDPRVSVIHQKNAGSSAARNAGLRHATGKYIMFCDSDDYVHESWCDELHRAICKYPTASVSCNVQKIETLSAGGGYLTV